MKQTDIDLTEAAANALRTAWLNGKASTTEGWALHVEAERLVEFIREQVAREIEAFEPDDRALVHMPDWREAMEDAARIARGEQP